MNIKSIRSDIIYRNMIGMPKEDKHEIFMRGLIEPFHSGWNKDANHIMDVLKICNLLGMAGPETIDSNRINEIKILSSEELWNRGRDAVQQSLHCFFECGIKLSVEEYKFTIMLGNPQNDFLSLNHGICGMGSVPGCILSWLCPDEQNLKRLPLCIAHEVNHNVRFQFERPDRDQVTLGEMLVIEGLAEYFALSLYPEDPIMEWINQEGADMFVKWVKPIMKEVLDLHGIETVSDYLYGYELADVQRYCAVGIPLYAGYGCGYHMIQYYLKKTRKTIMEATIIPAKEILKELEDFWEEGF